MARLPPVVHVIRSTRLSSISNIFNKYRYGMLVLTFFSYMSFHISRKPLSIVKAQLHRNCSTLSQEYAATFLALHHLNFESGPFGNGTDNETWCDFPPFNHNDYKSLFGELDYAFLFSYAIGMFFSGMVAERLPIRYFISSGMVLSGVFTCMFGIGYFANVHAFSFYVIAQILNGAFQTTGWPAVVTVVGNWFGKQRRGLIMGIWNSHTSFGNILGSVIASAFVTTNWGFSFIVPGIVIGSMGIINFFTLIEKPEDLGVRYQPIENVENSEGSDDSNEPRRPLSPNYEAVENRNILHDACNNQIQSKRPNPEHRAIGFFKALSIPGVAEFSLCLLFSKLVSYTFLFWLPFYIKNTSTTLGTEDAGLLSTFFDVGGIFGAILAGLISDKTGGPACTCSVMLLISAAMMYIFNVYGTVSLAVNITLLLLTGAFVNAPYALITTAVSADLGTHPILEGNAKALSTVTAIIDGTGSIGAALGPLFTGFILPYGWKNVFWMLIASSICAFLLLLRLVGKEIVSISRRSDPEAAAIITF